MNDLTDLNILNSSLLFVVILNNFECYIYGLVKENMENKKESYF